MLLGEEVRSEDDAMVGNINEVCASWWDFLGWTGKDF
jgi:hypothetical protein